MDDLTIDQVAGRLGKSRRWLQDRIKEPAFHMHHYIGRTPRWDEIEYRALRAAIVAAERAKRGDRAKRHPQGFEPSSATGIGTSQGPFGPQDVRDAFARVLDSPPPRKIGTPQTPFGSRSNPSSGTRSSTASTPRSRSSLRLIVS